jgi:coatomer subunit beta
MGAIAENLKHRHSYVRRNAVMCLYAIYLSFGIDIIADIPEKIETLLINETDLSTKRNVIPK